MVGGEGGQRRQSEESEKIWTRLDLRSRICNCCCLHSPEACKKISLNFVFLTVFPPVPLPYVFLRVKDPHLLAASCAAMQLPVPSFLNIGSVLPAHAIPIQKDFYRQVTFTDFHICHILSICHLLKSAGYSPTTVSCSHLLVPASSVTLGGGRKNKETAMRRWMLTPRARRRARGVKRMWVPRRSCRRMEWEVGGRRGRGSGASCMGRPSSSSSIGINSCPLWESYRV